MTKSLAVVMQRPQAIELRQLDLSPAQDPDDVLVQVEWTGISTGTERLLFTGKMPPFPGMGYPLVPGYETVGRVVEAPANGSLREGDRVFVPGANCFGDVRGLFGGSASHVRVPASRVVAIDEDLAEKGVLFALAATAQHAITGPRLPDLVVGHGVLGRLIARLIVAAGGSPTVWEKNPQRVAGARGYSVIAPETDERRDYQCICDVSGDASLLEPLLGRLSRGGELVLAGFYSDRLSFDFPLAFIKEARLRVAAQWQPQDLAETVRLASTGQLSLDGLITHRCIHQDVSDAYAIAFGEPNCLKMIVDWRNCS